MSTTKLRGGLGGESVVITAVEDDAVAAPKPATRPARITPTPASPREVNTHTADEETPVTKTTRTRRPGAAGPLHMTAADLTLMYGEYVKTATGEVMVKEHWLKANGVSAADDVIAEFLADTAEHAALKTETVEIPVVKKPDAEVAADVLAAAGASSVRVIPPAPPGLVDPVEAATKAAIRARVRRIAIACVLAIPVIAAGSSLLALPAMTALYVLLGTAAALVFVGPSIKDAIEEGLFKFVTVKVWIELGAAVAIAAGIGASLYFGEMYVWAVIVSLAVVTLLVKHSILAVQVAQASGKLPTVVEIREETTTTTVA